MPEPRAPRRLETPLLIAGAALLLAGWWAVNRFALDVYPRDPSEGGTIRVVQWGTDANPARAEQVAVFNRANRDRNLAVLPIPGGMDAQAVVTRSAAGDAPDVIDYFNPEDLYKYVSKGIARPLNEHLKRAGFDLADETWPALHENISLPNPAWKPGDHPIDRRLWYAVPNNVDWPVVYLNRSLYQRVAAERAAAGQPMPPEPWLGWTWWDYAALARVFNRRGPDGRFVSFGGSPPDPWPLIAQVGASMRGTDRAAFEAMREAERAAAGLAGLSWDECIAPFALRADGSFRAFPNRTAAATALQFIYDIQHAWRAVPTGSDMQQMATGAAGFGGGGLTGQFLAGNAGMMTNGRWYLMQIRANVSFDWRMVRVPRWVPYEEWARWQREGKGPGQRDGAWGDREHPDRGYLVLLNARATFLSGSARDPASAFRFLDMLVRSPDYNRIIMLEDGAGASRRLSLDYLAKPDPLVPAEAVNRTPEQELGAVAVAERRLPWPWSNYERYFNVQWGSLGAWMASRDHLERALAAPGARVTEPRELAAVAPGERFASADGIGAMLVERAAAEIEAAAAEGVRLDQPPRAVGPSWPTITALGSMAALVAWLAIGARRARRREAAHG